MDSNPKFSVIVPVYNKLPHIERAVNSVLQQTYQDFELILVDDASTDGSSEKLTEFADPRIKLHKRTTPGPGGYAARNLGIMHAANERICFLDADDEWELNLLETIAEVIKKNPDVEILAWGWTKVDQGTKENDRYTKKYEKDAIREFTLTDFFNGPQPMWMGGISVKKELIRKAGAFPEVGFKRGGDMDTWIRCLALSKKNLRITAPMTYYYLDSVNMVTKAIDLNASYSLSTFVNNILQKTDDKELKKAIRRFQNWRIYAVLSQQIGKGRGINYKLLFNMNLNKAFYYQFMRLHLKRILVGINLLKKHA